MQRVVNSFPKPFPSKEEKKNHNFYMLRSLPRKGELMDGLKKGMLKVVGAWEDDEGDPLSLVGGSAEQVGRERQ